LVEASLGKDSGREQSGARCPERPHKDKQKLLHELWVEMMELKTIEIEKAMKEVRGGEGQSPFDKVLKQNDFINILLRIWLMERRMPLHNIFLLKNLGNKTKKIISGALTVCPVPICSLGFFLLLALVSLGSGFLVSHP
jgi:hypothetical protein